jgi:predicted nucleic acid-binding protein
VTVVVDASVAVKWFIPEPGDAAAHQLLAGNEPLFAPALIRVEVAGAILRYFREGQIQEAKAHATLGAWDNLISNGILRRIDEEDLFHAAVAFSMICRHALADCFYLATAQSLDASVITADTGLHDRGKRGYKKIALLSGCGAN